jgi:hypothetical protein
VVGLGRVGPGVESGVMSEEVDHVEYLVDACSEPHKPISPWSLYLTVCIVVMVAWRRRAFVSATGRSVCAYGGDVGGVSDGGGRIIRRGCAEVYGVRR